MQAATKLEAALTIIKIEESLKTDVQHQRERELGALSGFRIALIPQRSYRLPAPAVDASVYSARMEGFGDRSRSPVSPPKLPRTNAPKRWRRNGAALRP